jgi:hypothetical protein
MTKYYMAHNAGRQIAGERFEVTEIFAGTAIGVFHTDDEAKIAELDKVVAQKTGVDEITAGEYDSALKKKAASLSSFQHSNPSLPTPVSLKSPAGVVVAEGPQEDLTEQNRLESVENALEHTAKIEAPEMPDDPKAE